jgi:hypothetical protein
MKTPITEAIEFFDYKDPNETFTAQQVVDKLNEFLEEEKQVITTAWIDGKKNDEFGDNVFDDGKNYFENKFKND